MKVLIGSSLSGIGMTESVQQNFESDCFTTILSQTSFRYDQNNFDNLLYELRIHDYGIFVFVREDFVEVENQIFIEDKANLMFGLFLGNLGIERTSCIIPDNLNLPIFSGLHINLYDSKRIDNLKAVCGAACSSVKEVIVQRGNKVDLNVEKMLNLTSHLIRTTTFSDVKYSDIMDMIYNSFEYDKAPCKISKLFGTAIIRRTPKGTVQVLGASKEIEIEDLVSLHNKLLNSLDMLKDNKTKRLNNFELILVDDKVLERHEEREYVLVLPMTANIILTIFFHCIEIKSPIHSRRLTEFLVLNNLKLIKLMRYFIGRCESCGQTEETKEVM